MLPTDIYLYCVSFCINKNQNPKIFFLSNISKIKILKSLVISFNQEICSDLQSYPNAHLIFLPTALISQCLSVLASYLKKISTLSLEAAIT